jgi:hypothetical protein
MLTASLIADAVAWLLWCGSRSINVTRPLHLYRIALDAERCLATYLGKDPWAECGCIFHRSLS